MKKIAIILFAALTAVSLTACKQQSDNSGDTQTQVSVPESSIQSFDESVTESVQENEPVNIPEISTDESSEPEFIEPVQTTVSDFQSIVVNNKCRLLLYTGTEQRISVPDKVTVDGKEYETEIGSGCFKDTEIISLTLPDNITEIPDSMCENCKKLEQATFANVQSIGKNAFWQCENLKFRFDDLNFGDQTKIKRIDDCAFGFTGMYGKVTIRPDMELTDGSFQVCEHITEVEILSGVTAIPNRAFAENISLEKITLPDTLTKIGQNAFMDTNVDTIIIPKSVTEIGYHAVTTNNVIGGKYTGIMLGYKGSAAETYANENNIVFSALD